MEDLVLDTDILVDYLRGKGEGVSVYERVVSEGNPHTTYVNKFELLCGADTDKEVNIILECLLGFKVLPFDDKSSVESSRIYRELKLNGKQINTRDIMIAGIAISNGLALTSRNVRYYQRITGLNLVAVS